MAFTMDALPDQVWRITVRSAAQFDDWATSTNKQTKLRRSGDLREARFRTIRSGQPFAFAERLR